jgi:hypothetical protein
MKIPAKEILRWVVIAAASGCGAWQLVEAGRGVMRQNGRNPMSAKVLLGMIGLFCFRCTGAVTAGEPAVTLKGAILETVEPPYSLSKTPSAAEKEASLYGRLGSAQEWFAKTPLMITSREGNVEARPRSDALMP